MSGDLLLKQITKTPADFLLLALSAHGKMSWELFKRAYADIMMQVDGMIPSSEDRLIQASRCLRLFAIQGHCDYRFSDDADYVYSTPVVMTALPNRIHPTAVLIGRRCQPILEKLTDVLSHVNEIRLSIESNNDSCSPCRIEIISEQKEFFPHIATLLSCVYLADSFSMKLLRTASGLDEYLSRCSTRLPVVIGEGERYDTDKLEFVSMDASDTASMQLVHLNTVDHRTYALVHNDTAHSVWKEYGIYALLREKRRQVLGYCRERSTFLVAVGAWLPVLFERALVLNSGRPPSYLHAIPLGSSLLSDRGFYVYDDIPESFAIVFAQKLGQVLVLF